MKNVQFRIVDKEDFCGHHYLVQHRIVNWLPFWISTYVNSDTGRAYEYDTLDEAEQQIKKEIEEIKKENELKNSAIKTVIKIFKTKFYRCNNCVHGHKKDDGCSIIGSKQNDNYYCGFFKDN